MRHSLPFIALLCASAAVAAPPPPVTAIAYHPDGRWLVAGLSGEVVAIDAMTGDIRARIGDLPGRVTALAFARDGKALALAAGEPGTSGVVKVYSVIDPGPTLALKATFAGHKDVIYALDFSPDGKTLASAGYDRVIHLWEVASDAMTPRLSLKDHSDTVYGLAFHPDGKLLASASADRAVKVWDATTGKRLYTLGDSTDWLYALAWQPDGKRLAAAGVDKSIRIWTADAAGGKLVQSVFAHQHPVTKLAYSKDGTALYSVGEGKSVKRWDAAKMVETLVFPPHADTVLSLAVRPDGKQIAVGRYDGVCQLLDADTGKVAAEPLPVKPKPPTVGKLTPAFGPRGRTTSVAIEGQNLDDATFTASIPGVTLQFAGAGSTKRQVEIAVGATVPAGPVAIVAKSAAGSSAPINFVVDRYPVVADSGADSATQGRTVKLPATLVGTIGRAGEADSFRFQAVAGQEIGAHVLAAIVGSKLEPALELTDAIGRTVAEGTNGLLAYRCPAAGTYAIGIRDKDYRGGADFTYRLHVGDIPIVSSVLPMGVQRGQTATVSLVGVNLPTMTATVSVPADAAIGSRVPIPLPAADKPLGEISVLVGEFPEVMVAKGAATIAVPGTANGVIGTAGETHAVRFTAKKGQRLLIETNARRSGSPLDSFIEVRDAAGKPVGRATLRSVARTFVAFRDHDSAGANIRLETWNDFAMDDYVYIGNELLKIHELPPGPDADCTFYAVAGQRVGVLDTTPGHVPMAAPVYKVELHPPGATFPPNGLPVYRLDYRNDDGGPPYGKDSRLFFDAPADGEYRVRVADSRGLGGPDFTVAFAPMAPAVAKGGAVSIAVSTTRIDGYEGPIRVALENLPAGFEAPVTTIEAGQQTATFALYASPMAPDPATDARPMKLVAKAMIDGKEVVREAAGGKPTVTEPGMLVTTTAVGEVTIRPGHEAKMLVKIERRNGFKGRVPLDVRGLPRGVRVLDIGLNGILVTERDSEREVAIYAESWVAETDHPFVVLSRSEAKNTEHAAKGMLLRVRK